MIIFQKSLLFKVFFLILGAKLRPENGNEELHKIKTTNIPQNLDNKHFSLLFRFFMTIAVIITYAVFFETSLQKFMLCFFKF